MFTHFQKPNTSPLYLISPVQIAEVYQETRLPIWTLTGSWGGDKTKHKYFQLRYSPRCVGLISSDILHVLVISCTRYFNRSTGGSVQTDASYLAGGHPLISGAVFMTPCAGYINRSATATGLKPYSLHIGFHYQLRISHAHISQVYHVETIGSSQACRAQRSSCRNVYLTVHGPWEVKTARHWRITHHSFP